jgi:hypothetical protein
MLIHAFRVSSDGQPEGRHVFASTRRRRGSVKPVSREADEAKRSGLTEPWIAGQSRVVMATVHAPCCTSAMSQDERGALVEERQEGGDRLPPQFRIQSECALTYMNASSR